MVSQNYIHISANTYLVKNQNAFNAALYFEYGCKEDDTGLYSKKELRDMIQNYPKEYPAIVVILDRDFGCWRIHVNVLEIDYLHSVRDNMDKALTKFKEWTKHWNLTY